MNMMQKITFANGIFFLFALNIHQVYSHDMHEFNYTDQNAWVKISPDCGGSRQSPINIDVEAVEQDKCNKSLSFENYDATPKSVSLTNHGHTVMLEFQWDDEIPTVSDGPLESGYQLANVHFHWNSQSDSGSEHSRDSLRYPMEIHVYHFKTEYGSYENALKYDDGFVAVAGFLSPNSDIFEKKELQGLNEVVNNLGSVQNLGDSTEINPFPMNELLFTDDSRINYFWYGGSHSMPPCTENVQWFVSTYEFNITPDQIKTFQSTVHFAHGDTHNNRDIQPLNGRTVHSVPSPK